MQRVLIVGASGYIGGAISRALLARGVAVTGLSRSAESDTVLSGHGITPLRGEARALPVLRAAASEHDAIVYAARYSDAEGAALGACAAAMQDTRKALVFISGASVVAQRTDGEAGPLVIAEHQKIPPPRESSIRIESEDIVRCSAIHGVRGMAIRPPIVYGHAGSVQIPLMAEKALAHGAVAYVGAGKNRWSFIHVDDLAAMTVAALERGLPGALYHATAGETEFRTLADAIGSALGLESESLDLASAETRYGKFAARIMLGSNCVLSASATTADLGFSASRRDLLQDVREGSYAAHWAAQRLSSARS